VCCAVKLLLYLPTCRSTSTLQCQSTRKTQQPCCGAAADLGFQASSSVLTCHVLQSCAASRHRGQFSCTIPLLIPHLRCLLWLLLSLCKVHLLLSPVFCCTTSTSSSSASPSAAAALCYPSSSSALFSALNLCYLVLLQWRNCALLSITDINAVNCPTLHLLADKTPTKLPIQTSWGCN